LLPIIHVLRAGCGCTSFWEWHPQITSTIRTTTKFRITLSYSYWQHLGGNFINLVMRVFSLRSITLLFVAIIATGISLAQNEDIRLLRQINVHRDKSLDGLMITITNCDYPVSIAVPAAELAQGLIKHDKKAMKAFWQTTEGLGLNFVVSYGLKYTVQRPRPFVTYPDIQPYERYTDYSFPSGHASFAFCTATAASICYPKWYIVAPMYLWAGAVSYSRLDLGVHYPSDVLAGAIIGAGSAWASRKVNQWLQRKRTKEAAPAH
jgi:membrane-associated phospholipid phosphatase